MSAARKTSRLFVSTSFIFHSTLCDSLQTRLLCSPLPLLHVFFNLYQLPPVFFFFPCDVTQIKWKKKKLAVKAVKASEKDCGAITRKTKHQPPRTAAATVIDHHLQQQQPKYVSLQITFTSTNTVKRREEEKMREDCKWHYMFSVLANGERGRSDG